MERKMCNIDMVQAVNGLVDFVRKDYAAPIALSVAISANIKTLQRELEPYEEMRQKILKERSKETKNRFKELCDIEVEVNLRTVHQDILSELELSTKDYMSLEFMLEPESQSE